MPSSPAAALPAPTADQACRNATAALDAAVTLLSLGTNRLVRSGRSWLERHGLVRWVIPVLIANEAFGIYRAYAVGGALGWW